MKDEGIRSFRRTLRRFERLNQLTNAICCEGITLAQCHALLEIEALVETTTKQLAENLKLDKSTLSRTIDGLTRRGFVRRGAHAHDRRFMLIRLTRMGKAKCGHLNRFNDSMYDDILGRFSQKERQVMLRSFDQMVHAMSQYCRETGTC